MSYVTRVMVFRVPFRPGVPVSEQVVYAAKKAIVSGQLRPGAAFPSVRALSRELKIHPNTAHKVIAELTSEGLLEVLPGIGTIVARRQPGSAGDRRRLLGREVEQLVVEAKKIGVPLDAVLQAVTEHWEELHNDELPDSH